MTENLLLIFYLFIPQKQLEIWKLKKTNPQIHNQFQDYS